MFERKEALLCCKAITCDQCKSYMSSEVKPPLEQRKELQPHPHPSLSTLTRYSPDESAALLITTQKSEFHSFPQDLELDPSSVVDRTSQVSQVHIRNSREAPMSKGKKLWPNLKKHEKYEECRIITIAYGGVYASYGATLISPQRRRNTRVMVSVRPCRVPPYPHSSQVQGQG